MMHRFYHEEDGATAVEYSLVAFVLALAVFAGLTFVGTR